MTMLVLGATGQVGRHLRPLLPSATFWDSTDADFSDLASLESGVRRIRPNLIINAAAYTAVDRAETEPALAWAVNAEAPAALARSAIELDALLIHISTDYVFDGEHAQPYREADPTNPINAYGRTKLAGDLAIMSICPQHWILRTSWVFSEFGANFVKTMLRLATERDTLRIVADQHGQPTFAGDLARLIAAIATNDPSDPPLPYGLYHVSGGEQTTWHGFAKEIVTRAHHVGLIDKSPVINAISTDEYPTPARRPRYSVMAMNDKLARFAGFAPNWRRGLEAALKGIACTAA